MIQNSEGDVDSSECCDGNGGAVTASAMESSRHASRGEAVTCHGDTCLISQDAAAAGRNLEGRLVDNIFE